MGFTYVRFLWFTRISIIELALFMRYVCTSWIGFDISCLELDFLRSEFRRRYMPPQTARSLSFEYVLSLHSILITLNLFFALLACPVHVVSPTIFANAHVL
jgi:hypothetical protein